MATFRATQGDTDPQTWTVGHAGAGDVLNADDVVTIYIRKVGATVNTVDGVEADSHTTAGVITWTPTAAHVETAGTFQAYVLATRADDTEVRFPSGDDYHLWVLKENFE